MLKRSLNLLLFAGMAAGLAWSAENPFIGEWKLDSSKSRIPDEMKVESKGGNTYVFNFGGGPETIVVDGTDQPGAYGGTTLSVKADGPNTWIVERKKDGRLLLRGTWKLAQDGRTLADYYREFEADGSTTVSMDYIYQRSEPGSGFAADWKSIKETMNSAFLLEVKAYQGDGLTFSLLAEHDTRNAMLDGKDYPNPGGKSSSSSRRVDEHTLEMTLKAGEKVIETREITISADGKALTMTIRAAGQTGPDVFVFDRE